MELPLQITFRNMPPSDVLEKNIREKTAKLDLFYDRIIRCRVIVEAPHRHHHQGKAYEVHIYLTVPVGEVVITHAPTLLSPRKLSDAKRSEEELIETHDLSKHAAHADVYVAIRDAFNAAGRKLQDYARRRTGAAKAHRPTLRARRSG
jgi:ribosome-associated translation inhibitor RaiA